jgi:hypothetical protein
MSIETLNEKLSELGWGVMLYNVRGEDPLGYNNCEQVVKIRTSDAIITIEKESGEPAFRYRLQVIQPDEAMEAEIVDCGCAPEWPTRLSEAMEKLPEIALRYNATGNL